MGLNLDPEIGHFQTVSVAEDSPVALVSTSATFLLFDTT
jgi:hypothetical protein